MVITKNMIKKGFDAGIVKLEISPNSDGVVCRIGDNDASNWFYFGGLDAERSDTVEEYQKNIPFDVIVDEIVETLNDFIETLNNYEDSPFSDELQLYETVFEKYCIKPDNEHNPLSEASTDELLKELRSRDNILSVKVYQKEDLEAVFKELKITPDDKVFNDAVNLCRNSWGLKDCHDAEWDAIKDAARTAAERGNKNEGK